MENEALRKALAEDDVLPVPDGVTVGSLGEDAVLLPEAQWRVLVEAARAYADLLENGQTFQWHTPMELRVPGKSHLVTSLPGGRYLVVPIQEES